jgi:hypothetical protein
MEKTNPNIVMVDGVPYQRIQLKVIAQTTKRLSEYIDDLEIDNEQLLLRLQVREQAIEMLQEKIKALQKVNVLVNTINKATSLVPLNRKIAALEHSIDKQHKKIKEQDTKITEQETKLAIQRLQIKNFVKQLDENLLKLSNQRINIQDLQIHKTNNELLSLVIEKAGLSIGEINKIVNQYSHQNQTNNIVHKNKVLAAMEMQDKIKALNHKIASLQNQIDKPSNKIIEASECYKEQQLVTNKLIIENKNLHKTIAELLMQSDAAKSFTELQNSYNELKIKHNNLASKNFVTNATNEKLNLKLKELKDNNTTPSNTPKNYTLEYTKPLKDKIAKQQMEIEELQAKIEILSAKLFIANK